MYFSNVVYPLISCSQKKLMICIYLVGSVVKLNEVAGSLISVTMVAKGTAASKEQEVVLGL